MSGVEAAGLVLGALPLMISALEHYRATAEVLNGWRWINADYRKCRHELIYCNDEFQTNLQELLLPMIADDEKLKILLEDPGGPSWEDPELNETLKKRIPSRYNSYVDTIHMLLDVVKGLEEALGMKLLYFTKRVTEDSVSRPSKLTLANFANAALSRENIQYQTQRIRHATSKSKREELFNDFETYNKRLANILGASDRISSLTQTRSSRSIAVDKGLWKLWNHGSTLYKLLVAAWSCQCRPFHQANLLLQHRSSSTVTFQVVFWFTPQLTSRPLPWTWQATNISLVEKPAIIDVNALLALRNNNIGLRSPAIHTPANSRERPPSTALQNGDPKSSRRSLPSRWKHTLLKSSMKRETTVTSPEENRPIANTKVTFETQSAPSQSLQKPSTAEITNLCERIACYSPDLSQYGSLSGEVNQYLVRPLTKADSDLPRKVTLESLLSGKSGYRFERKERLHTALILASSYMQLYPTPWLKSKWTKKDIFFFYSGGLENICTYQPYISQDLSGTVPHAEADSSTDLSAATTDAFKVSIENLGIMLLELCFGKVIEENDDWKKIASNVAKLDEKMLRFVNYSAARDWYSQVLGESGPEYLGAVRWCLHYVANGSSDEKADTWREDMFVEVVEPLKVCHGHLCITSSGR
ncbi:hypothetical protein V495_05476 [Pseudogymnoascus sp. VKM F-4514 (FW-929)]|nr:hypothetical protein V495_05476 [Pseudogymnoascus sp. VKM F-4514 (FW-929)]KFY58817.1 hypothetical protein V497_04638 [Pseudogymnoascus sp. VKM F-4516 (FW-969)]